MPNEKKCLIEKVKAIFNEQVLNFCLLKITSDLVNNDISF